MLERPLFHRERELAELDRAWGSGRPELLLALGRRRAGKSFLLTRYLRSRKGFYYQATRSTSREQLRSLSEAVGGEYPESGLSYSAGLRSWDTFFEFVIKKAGQRPFLLVLDETSYLLEVVRGFGTILQKQWDHGLQGTQIKLVLSGSYISAMNRLTAADQPLYGRRTGKLHFAPFNYAHAAAFVPQYSPRDRLSAYGIFGGLPGQLALIDPRRSLADNVADHLLSPSGRLSDEGAHLFDAFLRDAGVHYSIVRAIAHGEHRWSKITSRVGKESASLSRPLEWLQGMEVVTRVIPVTDTPPGHPKRVAYRLADPYMAFWHRFVAALRATGAVDALPPRELWARHVEPHLPEYMGPVFENACRTFVSLGKHPRLPFLPDRVGEWWTDDGQDQIDVVALGPGGQVLLGECKWGQPSHQDLATLEHRRDRALSELSGTSHIVLAIFTGADVLKDHVLLSRMKETGALLFTLEDLYLGGDSPD